MRILVVADTECPALWDYYTPGMLKEYDLILSSGDLKAEYLRFLVTMARCPLLYVHGNHDKDYAYDPPEGCDSIEDKLVIYRGLRILGLGGSGWYNGGSHQYTEKQMRRRIRKLQKAIRLAGGVDVVLTHAAPKDAGDAQDQAHQGFETFQWLIRQCRPKYLLHGHVHLNYGGNLPRIQEYSGTRVINCCEKYSFDYAPREKIPEFSRLKRFWAKIAAPNLEIWDL